MGSETGKLSSSEYDRVVGKTLADRLLDRPFSARREGLTVSDHVRLAKAKLAEREIFSEQLAGSDPFCASAALFCASVKAYCAGYLPSQCSFGLCFPTEYTEKQMRAFIKEAEWAAEKAGVRISCVDVCRAKASVPEVFVSVSTKSPEASVPEVCVSVSTKSHEEIPDGADEETEASENGHYPESGDGESGKPKASGNYSLVLAGNPAAAGTILLRNRNKEELESKYPKHFLDTEFLKDALFSGRVLERLGRISSYMQAVGAGGVFAALWELGEKTHLGMKTDLQKIKLDSLTVEICESLDISPYELLGGGEVIAVTRIPEAAVAVCTEAGVRASVIGVLEKGNERLVVKGEETRFLEPFRKEIYGN